SCYHLGHHRDLHSFPTRRSSDLAMIDSCYVTPAHPGRAETRPLPMTKRDITAVLEEIAFLLELKGENPFKVKAYETGARVIESRSEEHTSELQSRGHLVCRLLLE